MHGCHHLALRHAFYKTLPSTCRRAWQRSGRFKRKKAHEHASKKQPESGPENINKVKPAGFNTNCDAAISFTMYEREAKEQIKWEDHGLNSIFGGHSPGSTR